MNTYIISDTHWNHDEVISGICQVLDYPDSDSQFVWNWNINIDCGNAALTDKKTVYADPELLNSDYNKGITPIPKNITKYWTVQEYNGRGWVDSNKVNHYVGVPILFYNWNYHIILKDGEYIRERWKDKWSMRDDDNTTTYKGKYSDRVNGSFGEYRKWPWAPQE